MTPFDQKTGEQANAAPTATPPEPSSVPAGQCLSVPSFTSDRGDPVRLTHLADTLLKQVVPCEDRIATLARSAKLGHRASKLYDSFRRTGERPADAQRLLQELEASQKGAVTSQTNQHELEAFSSEKGVLLNAIGLMHIVNGDTDHARNAFWGAIAMQPTFIQAYAYLADLYLLDLNDEDVPDRSFRAEKVLRDAQKVDPASYDVAIRLGRLYMMQERWVEAAENLLKALEVRPSLRGEVQLAELQFADTVEKLEDPAIKFQRSRQAVAFLGRLKGSADQALRAILAKRIDDLMKIDPPSSTALPI